MGDFQHSAQVFPLMRLYHLSNSFSVALGARAQVGAEGSLRGEAGAALGRAQPVPSSFKDPSTGHSPAPQPDWAHLREAGLRKGKMPCSTEE